MPPSITFPFITFSNQRKDASIRGSRTRLVEVLLMSAADHMNSGSDISNVEAGTFQSPQLISAGRNQQCANNTPFENRAPFAHVPPIPYQASPAVNSFHSNDRRDHVNTVANAQHSHSVRQNLPVPSVFNGNERRNYANTGSNLQQSQNSRQHLPMPCVFNGNVQPNFIESRPLEHNRVPSFSTSESFSRSSSHPSSSSRTPNLQSRSEAQPVWFNAADIGKSNVHAQDLAPPLVKRTSPSLSLQSEDSLDQNETNQCFAANKCPSNLMSTLKSMPNVDNAGGANAAGMSCKHRTPVYTPAPPPYPPTQKQFPARSDIPSQTTLDGHKARQPISSVRRYFSIFILLCCLQSALVLRLFQQSHEIEALKKSNGDFILLQESTERRHVEDLSHVRLEMMNKASRDKETMIQIHQLEMENCNLRAQIQRERMMAIIASLKNHQFSAEALYRDSNKPTSTGLEGTTAVPGEFNAAHVEGGTCTWKLAENSLLAENFFPSRDNRPEQIYYPDGELSESNRSPNPSAGIWPAEGKIESPLKSTTPSSIGKAFIHSRTSHRITERLKQRILAMIDKHHSLSEAVPGLPIVDLGDYAMHIPERSWTSAQDESPTVYQAVQDEIETEISAPMQHVDGDMSFPDPSVTNDADSMGPSMSKNLARDHTSDFPTQSPIADHSIFQPFSPIKISFAKETVLGALDDPSGSSEDIQVAGHHTEADFKLHAANFKLLQRNAMPGTQTEPHNRVKSVDGTCEVLDWSTRSRQDTTPAAFREESVPRNGLTRHELNQSKDISNSGQENMFHRQIAKEDKNLDKEGNRTAFWKPRNVTNGGNVQDAVFSGKASQSNGSSATVKKDSPVREAIKANSDSNLKENEGSKILKSPHQDTGDGIEVNTEDSVPSRHVKEEDKKMPAKDINVTHEFKLMHTSRPADYITRDLGGSAGHRVLVMDSVATRTSKLPNRNEDTSPSLVSSFEARSHMSSSRPLSESTPKENLKIPLSYTEASSGTSAWKSSKVGDNIIQNMVQDQSQETLNSGHAPAGGSYLPQSPKISSKAPSGSDSSSTNRVIRRPQKISAPREFAYHDTFATEDHDVAAARTSKPSFSHSTDQWQSYYLASTAQDWTRQRSVGSSKGLSSSSSYGDCKDAARFLLRKSTIASVFGLLAVIVAACTIALVRRDVRNMTNASAFGSTGSARKSSIQQALNSTFHSGPLGLIGYKGVFRYELYKLSQLIDQLMRRAEHFACRAQEQGPEVPSGNGDDVGNDSAEGIDNHFIPSSGNIAEGSYDALLAPQEAANGSPCQPLSHAGSSTSPSGSGVRDPESVPSPQEQSIESQSVASSGMSPDSALQERRRARERRRADRADAEAQVLSSADVDTACVRPDENPAQGSDTFSLCYQGSSGKMEAQAPVGSVTKGGECRRRHVKFSADQLRASIAEKQQREQEAMVSEDFES